MPKFSPWEGHRSYSPRGSISVRTSQSLQHNPLAQQNNSRCTTTRNCSSSNSWSRQSEDKYKKVCLQGQESLSRTKSPFASHASSHLQLSSNMDAELPVILAAQNLTINPSPSSRVQGHPCTVYCPLPRIAVAATYTVPSRHRAWQFLATSATCPPKLRWLAMCHTDLKRSAVGILAKFSVLLTQSKVVCSCS